MCRSDPKALLWPNEAENEIGPKELVFIGTSILNPSCLYIYGRVSYPSLENSEGVTGDTELNSVKFSLKIDVIIIVTEIVLDKQSHIIKLRWPYAQI